MTTLASISATAPSSADSSATLTSVCPTFFSAVETFFNSTNTVLTEINESNYSAQNSPFTAKFALWNAGTSYLAGNTVYGSDYKCYRAIANSTGQNPTTATTYWVPLTFTVASNGALDTTIGGTSAITAAAARTNLSAAARGVNTDITSLTGLSTPLAVSQGGTSATASGEIVNGLGGGVPGQEVLEASTVSAAQTALDLAPVKGFHYTTGNYYNPLNNHYGNSMQPPAGYIYYRPYRQLTTRSMASISFIVGAFSFTPNAKVRLGIYSDNNGTPGTLIFSGEITLTSYVVNQRNHVAYTTSIPAGNYWLAYLADKAIWVYSTDGSNFIPTLSHSGYDLVNNTNYSSAWEVRSYSLGMPTTAGSSYIWWAPTTSVYLDMKA